MFWIWEDEFSQLRGMLSNMLIFWEYEREYAYKRYAYKKRKKNVLILTPTESRRRFFRTVFLVRGHSIMGKRF